MDGLAKARDGLDSVASGPWELRPTSTVYMDGTGVYHIRTGGVPGVRGRLTVTRPDAEHIARYDPPTVAAMLDVIEAAREVAGEHDGHDMECDRCRLALLLARAHTMLGDDDG